MEGLPVEVEVIVAAFEFSFMGGSMGSVVGEKIYKSCKRMYK